MRLTARVAHRVGRHGARACASRTRQANPESFDSEGHGTRGWRG